MERRGFTPQELREVFHLDPDRPEDRPVIAALQSSLARQLDEPVAPAAHRSLRDMVRQLLNRHGRHAA
jgi:predicted transcriptional regulator